MDYNKLFVEQDLDLTKQLPERFRQQLEAGEELVVLDEEELQGEYRGGELVRIQAVDFGMDADEEYTCKFRLQMKLEPLYSKNGVMEDEEGDTFFTVMVPFFDKEGNQIDPDPLPGESEGGIISGFKSYKIRLDDLVEAGFADENLYSYLRNQAEAWVNFVDEHGGDAQAPYIERDENDRSYINRLSGLITCDYMDFALDIRQNVQYGDGLRYGIDDLNFEGLRRLQTSGKVSRRSRKEKGVKTNTISRDNKEASSSKSSSKGSKPKSTVMRNRNTSGKKSGSKADKM